MSNRIFVRNVFSLSLLQGVNLLLPLLVLPFLVRVLGVESYGLYVFSGVVVGYFGLICDYGFNLSGTRDVSKARHDKALLSELVTKIYTIKLLLFLMCTVGFGIVALMVPGVKENALLYWCAYGIVVGQALFPTWFFQGVEDFKSIVILNFLSKLFFTLMIFVVVRDSTEAYLAALLNSIGAFLSAVLAIFIMVAKYKVGYVKSSKSSIYAYAKNSFYIFLAQVKISLFSTTNIFILGLVCGPKSVGYFSVAERSMRALAQLQSPILTALFPRLSLGLVEQKEHSIRLIKKLVWYGSCAYLLIAVILFLFAEAFVVFVFGSEYIESVSAFRIVLLCPLLIYLNNIFGTQILLNVGKDKLYMLVLFTAGIFNLFASYLMTLKFDFIGTAWSLLLSELIVAAGMFYFAKSDLFDRKATL